MQESVLRTLAGTVPPWTLSGGGALAGWYTRHRTTRDLDLFWQGQRTLGSEVEDVRRRLVAAGLTVDVLQRAEAFCRLDVRRDGDSTIVDLVADPVPLAERPVETDIGGVHILVDTPHQILVNKLCALLSRSELRDLQDVQVLLAAGGDLPRALEDAPRQDGGFSPLTFAYSLSELPIPKLAKALGWTHDAAVDLARFRDALVERMLALALPTA